MMKPNKPNDGLVYSTGQGRMCPQCGHPVNQCACKPMAAQTAGDGIVRVSRQTKGRKGKGVTLISGVPLGPAELNELARELKNRCGCGGTIKDGIIEIQGDQRERIVEELKKKGWTVKLAGG